MASSNSSRKGRNTTRTHEGGHAIIHDAKTQLERSVLACLLWEDSFYESGEDIAARILRLSKSLPVQDVVEITLKAKQDMYLRHAPLYLVNSLLDRAIEANRADISLSDLVYTVCTRADDLPELLSIYWKNGKKPLSAQLKKGLAKAFNRFDEYQLAKYNRDREIRLRDVLFLSHAKPADEGREALYNALANDTLMVPNTWEVRISECGSDVAAKRAVWEDMLSTGTLGALAFLRNLRNMSEAKVDKKLIRNYFSTMKNWNRISPFQFLSAYRVAPEYSGELETAMLSSCSNVPKLSGNTALIIDVSGSMDDVISRKSTVTRLDTATGLAIVLREVCESVSIMMFGTNNAMVPTYRGIALRDYIQNQPRRMQIGYGTNTGIAINAMYARDRFDRTIVVTDEQAHDRIQNPQKTGYIINVGSYEPSIAYGPWNSLTGWSDKIVEYIAKREF